jgi:uncharacterized protein
VETLLSVRGEAQRSIPPDYVTLWCALSSTAASKAAALRSVRAAKDSLISSLGRLGGVALTVESGRSSLTWSVGSLSTRDEHDFNKVTGSHGPTGRVVADANVVVAVRDLERLDEVNQVLAEAAQLNISSASWHVDADNPAWGAVRADAIAAAIDKGRDYAAALHGVLVKVEHVADVGLLGGDHAGGSRSVNLGYAAAASAGMDGGAGTPSLDPVPQEIRAIVEARFSAAIEALDAPE